MRLRRSRLAACVVLLAWFLLAMHLCADPSAAHDAGAREEMGSHGHHHGEASVPGAASSRDCHSAWVSHNPPALGGQSARETPGSPVIMSVWVVVVAPALVDRIPPTNRAPDSAPPLLYLLHAALLI